MDHIFTDVKMEKCDYLVPGSCSCQGMDTEQKVRL